MPSPASPKAKSGETMPIASPASVSPARIRNGRISAHCTTIWSRSPPLAVTLNGWPWGWISPVQAARAMGIAPSIWLTSLTSGTTSPREITFSASSTQTK